MRFVVEGRSGRACVSQLGEGAAFSANIDGEDGSMRDSVVCFVSIVVIGKRVRL